MRINSTEILLVGESLLRCPELLGWLDDRGCTSEFSASFQDAVRRTSRKQFDLVISEYQLPDRSAFPMLDLLAGSGTTLFSSRALAADFLWLLMLDRGRRSIGSPVLRSHNLRGALDRVLNTLEGKSEAENLAHELSYSPFVDAVSR